MSVSFKVPNFGYREWKELPENPLIAYDDSARAAIGDPQVITPEEFDGKWHMFFHGFLDGGQSFFHHVSDDGIHWKEKKRWRPSTVGQNSMYCDGNRWIMYYTCCNPAEFKDKYGCTCIIRAKTTRDFENWSEEVDIILPETPEEREGKVIEARNPCAIMLPDGRVRLYYSAGTVWLEDCNYEEPKYLFYAESDNPLGPFKMAEVPILTPDPAIPYRNFACGAIKVFGYEKGYLALYNPLWKDEKNASRSAICLLASDDGIHWEEAACNPVIIPDKGWKAAIVYQLDIVHRDDALWIYFNARDEWHKGIERIGCSRLDLHGGSGLKKLRKPFL
jgi:predicted GH43/DUF377 family glycosyl hydrolase